MQPASRKHYLPRAEPRLQATGRRVDNEPMPDGSFDYPLAIAHALSLLLLPLMGVAFVRWRARRALADGSDSAAVYFASAQWLGALPLLVVLGLTASADTPLAAWVEFTLVRSVGEIAPLAWFPVVMLPLAITLGATTWAAYGITKMTRGTDWTPRETAVQAAWALAILAAPVLGFSLCRLAYQHGEFALGVGLVAASIAAMTFARVRWAKHLGIDPHAVTRGPLRDRLISLAAKAGVQIGQLYVVPMRRVRMANAFAVRRDIVMVTDWLVEHLDRREVDAVLAHELAHLKLGHPRKLGLVALAGAGVSATAMAVTGVSGAVALGTLVAVVATRFVSRRFELQADALGVRLCGDPEASITGLVRLTRLNHVPLSWSRNSERALTHPSTLRRIEAIARAAGIPDARVRELLAHDEPALDRDSVPVQAQPGGKVFSTAFKTGVTLRLAWLLLLAAAAMAVAGVSIVRPLALPRPLAAVAGALLGFAAVVVITDLLAARGLASLRAPVAGRVGAPAGARFVGLSPGTAPRVYEGFFDWDLGYLSFEADALAYRGEEATFRLPRAAVLDVRRHPGPPGWIAAPRVAIEWSDPVGGASGVVQLRPAAVSRLAQLPAAVANLLEEIRSWRSAQVSGLTGQPVPPPLESDVTGTPLAQVVSPATLVPIAGLLAVLCGVLAGLVRLPLWPFAGPGALDVWLGAMLAAVLQRLPMWRAEAARPKEARPKEARPERRAA
jgi:Zn-dependent protease with chaperone function